MEREITVLFVGDQPSKRTDPDIPFKGALCEARLNSWVKYLVSPSNKVVIVNRVMPEFLIVVKWYINRGYPIIALGNEAAYALKDVPHFKLPHPSGRNRLINDRGLVDNQLRKCRQWIRGYRTTKEAV